jgi:adenylate cyclase
MGINWSITLAASIFGLVLASLFTRSLVQPVRRLLQGTKSVEQGNLAVELTVTSSDEIAALTKSFNHMVAELRQKELIKATFGKYVDPRIVTGLIENQQFAEQGERRNMTVFFSDLEGFTALSERLTPDTVVRLLNQYFTLMSEPISRQKGIIDKYIGDAIMAFWGPPFTSETEHPTLACLTALDQLARLDEFRRMLPDVLGLRKGLPVINVRIGIATGDVTVGNIGSDSARGYTVIGDTVNLASRLETANKLYGSHILISEDTWKATHDAVETRELDYARVVGKSDPVRMFEVLARKGDLDSIQTELRDHFEEGLRAYRLGEWDLAETRFRRGLAVKAGDIPSSLFLTRVAHLREHPPDHWDGVWSLAEK